MQLEIFNSSFKICFASIEICMEPKTTTSMDQPTSSTTRVRAALASTTTQVMGRCSRTSTYSARLRWTSRRRRVAAPLAGVVQPAALVEAEVVEWSVLWRPWENAVPQRLRLRPLPKELPPVPSTTCRCRRRAQHRAGAVDVPRRVRLVAM